MILVIMLFFLPYLMAIAGGIIALIHLICFMTAPKGSQERDEEKHSLIVTLIVFGVLTAATFGLSFLVSHGVISMM